MTVQVAYFNTNIIKQTQKMVQWTTVHGCLGTWDQNQQKD